MQQIWIVLCPVSIYLQFPHFYNFTSKNEYMFLGVFPMIDQRRAFKTVDGKTYIRNVFF